MFISDAFLEKHELNPKVKNFHLWYWIKKNNLNMEILAEKAGISSMSIVKTLLYKERDPSLDLALFFFVISNGEVPLTSMVVKLDNTLIKKAKRLLIESKTDRDILLSKASKKLQDLYK